MIRTTKATPMLDLLRESGVFEREPLVVFDAGCSGGVSGVWNRFGPSLTAHGFDPVIDECERLTAAERRPGVRYHAAYVGSPHDPDPQEFGLNPWFRLSTAHFGSQRVASTPAPPAPAARLADPAGRVGVAEFAEREGLTHIDVLKVDVDGSDYTVLRSAERLLDARAVVCVAIEVNYFGSSDERANTFHNVDRYLRTKDFALFGLDIRHYSRVDLPAPFVTRSPAHTAFGAPLQGNALYFRDVAAPHVVDSASISTGALAKQAALFELFQLPDCAAELINRYHERFATLAPVESLLDALVQPLAPGTTYREYRRRFQEHPESFIAAETAARASRAT